LKKNKKLILPNYTQVPNLFLDNLYQFEGSEVKVFLAICRKTIGWHKVSDRISYSQLNKITGLSTNGLKNAIDRLVNEGLITQKMTKNGYIYDISVSLSDRAVSLSDTDRVSLSDSTKESIKKINIKEKHIYYNFDMVLLTEKEHDTLIKKYGEKSTKLIIEKLHYAKLSKGYQYKSDYGALNSWVIKDTGIKEVIPVDAAESTKKKKQADIIRIMKDNGVDWPEAVKLYKDQCEKR